MGGGGRGGVGALESSSVPGGEMQANKMKLHKSSGE